MGVCAPADAAVLGVSTEACDGQGGEERGKITPRKSLFHVSGLFHVIFPCGP